VSVASPHITSTDELTTRAGESLGQWFGVPAIVTIVAPTRTAADELAKTIAKERLARMLDFSVKSIRVVGRQPPTAARRAPATWLVEAVFAISARDPEEARSEVERACRREGAASHLFLDFGAANEIEDEDRLNATCRRHLADTATVLIHELREDLATIAEGTPFAETWTFADHLPARFADAYDPALLERWINTVEAVGIDLLRYPETYLASTAEELAAHAILNEAHTMLDRLSVGETAAGEEVRRQLTEKIKELHDLAFEDHDILMAFWDPPSPADNPHVAAMAGIVHFTPDEWFKPFREFPND
jgi:hypothetical protein